MVKPTKYENSERTTKKMVCRVCLQDHPLRFCKKFLQVDYKERMQLVSIYRYCAGCLSHDHTWRTCESTGTCKRCGDMHHTLLHKPGIRPSSSARKPVKRLRKGPSSSDRPKSRGPSSSQHSARGPSSSNGQESSRPSSSQALVLSHSRNHRTPARRKPAYSKDINRRGRSPAENIVSLPTYHLQETILLKPTAMIKIVSRERYIFERALIDPGSESSIISEDVVRRLGAKTIRVGNKEKCLLNIRGNHGISATVETYAEVRRKHSVLTPRKSVDERIVDEFPGLQLADPQFHVAAPAQITLGVSREKAQRQFLRNESSLVKKPDLKLVYDNVLAEYHDLGQMMETDYAHSDFSGSFYLPHHAVFKPESSSTKVRVVFNASSRSSSGLSLNDILYTGPILQNDLMLLIVRWRFYRYVFNGDIEKMYRQILVDPEQTKFQRIVFRKNPDEDLKDFELKTVTFGVNCAPFLAIRTLLQLADDVEDKWPLASKILRRMMYVDDALAGTHDISLAIKARDQLILALTSAGFSMRKWTSNDERILHGLPTDFLLNENFLEIDDESTTKTLGIRWNAKLDQFYFATSHIPVKDSFTKREVLSIIAKLFDPAGWLGPIVIIAKMLMQQIWSEKTDWDDTLSDSSGLKWKQFLLDYGHIDGIKIARWVGFKPSARLEIHGFADASEKAYGACVYVRIQDKDGSIQSHLLLAKSKVAPLRTVSLPRLELCAAALLAELIDVVRKDLSFDESRTKVFTWSDSMIVLAWLQKPPKSWTTFVANRVSKIVGKTGKDCWRHVSSNDNPADLISRGVRPQDLVENRLWWHGPSWLCSSSDQWDSSPCEDFGTREEERTLKVFFSYFKSYCDLLEDFSSYSRALRVMALVVRGINRILKIKGPGYASVEVTADEINSVKEKLIIVAQKVAFSREYYKLSQKEPILESKLSNLNLFLDEKGIIRVGGRLANAPNLTYNEKFPILLPSNCQFSLLLVNFIHKITLHGGNQLMLRVLRTEFFIPRGKNLIKTVIGRCKICTIQKKAAQNQIMAALPTSRTIISRPFTTTGVDFAGPFDIRNFTGRACLITKGYVCVFVCFATKAIHLEAVSSLSTPAFLAAFSRFVSRRGYPKDMHSDNGTNFVGASKEIKAKGFEEENLSNYFVRI